MSNPDFETMRRGEGEPEWAAQCRACVHLKVSYRGRWWRCHAAKAWCSEARQPGAACDRQGKLFQAKEVAA